MATKSRKTGKKMVPRKPPVRIPLPFDQAIEGLLTVAPKKKAKRKKKPGKSLGGEVKP